MAVFLGIAAPALAKEQADALPLLAQPAPAAPAAAPDGDHAAEPRSRVFCVTLLIIHLVALAVYMASAIAAAVLVINAHTDNETDRLQHYWIVGVVATLRAVLDVVALVGIYYRRKESETE